MDETQSTHTPGPWRAAFTECGGYDCMTDAWHISATVGGGWPAPIATVDLSHYGQSSRTMTIPDMSRAKAEADARLIAAAPDLLEAANAVYNCDWYSPESQDTRLVFDKLIRAIRKAEGQVEG